MKIKTFLILLGVLFFAGTGFTFVPGMSFDTLQAFFGDAFSHEITKMTAAFTIAAYLHSSQVKKEIERQAEKMTSALLARMAAQEVRIVRLEAKTGIDIVGQTTKQQEGVSI